MQRFYSFSSCASFITHRGRNRGVRDERVCRRVVDGEFVEGDEKSAKGVSKADGNSNR